MIRLLVFTLFICGFVQLSVQQDPQCSASKLCPSGCCSSAGYCGFGPDYCGKGCQSTCDRKSQCNPGWNGSQWSDIQSCPLNVCCSKSGYCGYTEEFCGDATVKRPSCANDKTVTRLIGYYESWAPSQRNCYSMMPEEIPYGQYTDIIFSFATINPSTFQVSAGDSQTEYLMTRFGTIKTVQPDIKLWVALGGWAFSDPGPTQRTFSDIAASSANTDTFLDSLVQMMNKYGLDGIDIDWEYPVADDRNGRSEDFENTVTFMKKVRERMNDSKKGVSMAIPASYWYLQNFDIKALEPQVDWFNLMSYDMHGSWDIKDDGTGSGPWANSHTNMTEIQMALDLLWRNDISPTKVTMGMSFYSRSFTLTDPTCNKLGCRVSSGGNAGNCSDTVGVLLHPEIQDIISDKKLTSTLDRDGAVKTVSWDNQWVSFDDVATWRLKGNIARSQCIEGFMVWAISQDDKKGTNIQALNTALGRKTQDFPAFTPVDQPIKALPNTNPLLCRWSSCFEGCAAGFKEVQRDGFKEIMLDTTVCSSQFPDLGMSRLCCPSSQPLPTCTWRGHKNSGKCEPGCKAGEVEVGTLNTGCKKWWQSACCTSTPVTEAYGQCLWTSCTKDYENICTNKAIAFSNLGWSGEDACRSGESRALCCRSPVPSQFTNDCKWVPKSGHLTEGGLNNICEGACPEDSVKLSLSLGFSPVPGRETACYGYNAFCCSDPKPIKPRDPTGTDPFGSSQAKEFKLLIAKYMENPSCPATILVPPVHDSYKDVESKRDLISESQQHEILQGRATDCLLGNWERMLSYATLMFSMSQVGFDGIRSIWDNDLAGHFDSEIEVAAIKDYLYDYPWLDTRAHLEYVLLNPLSSGQGMRTARRAGSQLCHLPGSTGTTRRNLANGSSGAVDIKRKIWTMNSDRSGIPNLSTILAGILDGSLSLHYARWQYAWGQESNAPPGPFLELAYWIGPTPGVDTTTDRNYDQYRDTTRTYRQYGADRWVVVHMHIDPGDTDWLLGHEGHTYMGVPGFRVFHGQQVRPADNPNSAWRVDGRLSEYPSTERSGWDCPQDEGYWYVGLPGLAPEGVVGLIQRWGEQLWARGYVGQAGLRFIVEPPAGGSRGELDPHNPGFVVRPPNGWTTAAGNQNPYNINFLIDSEGLYNFFPAAPPPPPPRRK